MYYKSYKPPPRPVLTVQFSSLLMLSHHNLMNQSVWPSQQTMLASSLLNIHNYIDYICMKLNMTVI